MITLPPIDELNALDTADLAGTLGHVFETNPPLLERLARRRPFRSYADILAAARDIVSAMPDHERVAILASHPRIGARGPASEASRREQGATASAEVERELARLQDEYEGRHGFRFVAFVAGRPRERILEMLRGRVANARDVELATGIAEYLAICADRAGVRQRSGAP